VDNWARRAGRSDIFAQIGTTKQPPRHLRWTRMLDPIDFRHHFWEAELVIAHAGAGTILTAMEMSRPLLVMPRIADNGETRSNHQFATARQFQATTPLAVAADETQLGLMLDAGTTIAPMSRVGSYASPRLLENVRSIIETGVLAEPQLRLIPAPRENDAAAVENLPARRKAA
jgi:UDP-N-acetylglucosamine transferase subunit ALG13